MTDTEKHISRVQALLAIVIVELNRRGKVHDKSKLEEPERSLFESVEGKLKGLTYGTDEYRRTLKEIRPAIQHHYDHNTHHPEHFEQKECIICFTRHHRNHTGQCTNCGNGEMTPTNGLEGMSLLDLLEMFVDWKAAGERHTDSTMKRSIEHNQIRFGMNKQLVAIFENTRRELGWE